MGKASEVTGVAVEQVTARTLRRHTTRIENRTAELHCDLQSLLSKLDGLMDRLAEQAERLRVIEGDIEKIQRNMGVMAKHSQVPRVPLAQVHPLRCV